jgi:hypothetical protein
MRGGSRVLPPSTPPLRKPLGLAWQALVFAAACACGAWMLELPFQYDDYVLLGDPWRLFGDAAAASSELAPGTAPFMLRWTTWLCWGWLRELGPEPLDPRVHHAVGLCLHALVCVLLARIVWRATGSTWGARIAGLAFALCAGGAQAVSWIAAWGDVLAALFALIALEALLAARESHPRRALALRAAAVFAFFACLVAKEPALIFAPALALVLASLALAGLRAGGAARARAARTLAVELGVIALGLLGSALARRATLGTFDLTYAGHPRPPLSELPELLRGGLQVLAQALYPWNRDALFDDMPPWLGALGGMALPLGLLALVALGGVFGHARARAPLCACALLALVCSVPSGAITIGSPTNVLSRTAYAPLLPVCALLGLACAAWFKRPRARAFGLLGCALLALVFADGRAHYLATERTAADEQRAFHALLHALRDEQAARASAAPLAVVAVLPEPGYADIPLLGPLAPRAFRAPFARGNEIELTVVGHPYLLRDAFVEQDWSERDLALVETHGIRAGLEPARAPRPRGAAARAERMPVRTGALRFGLQPGAPRPRWELLEQTREAQTYAAAPAWPAHALRALELELPASPATGARLSTRAEAALPDEPRPSLRERHELVFAAAVLPQRAALELPIEREVLLGAPLDRLLWESSRPLAQPPRALARLPLLETLEPLARLELCADPRVAAPRVRVRTPAGYLVPPMARVEFALGLVDREVRLCSDVALPLAGREPGASFELELVNLHPAPDVPPGRPMPGLMPWALFAESVLLPEMHRRARTRIDGRWRVALHHTGGARAALSEWHPLRLVRELD